MANSTKYKLYFAGIFLSLFICHGIAAPTEQIKEDIQSEYSICLYDSARSRIIPLTMYPPTYKQKNNKVVIFSHGYGRNLGGSDKEYSHINRNMASHGYFVISIQHELPTDDLLSMDGDLFKTRMPNWEKGVQNILFVIHELKKLKPELEWNDVTLIGHSNGGDMSALFASQYPQLIDKVILLDNRRVPLPRTSKPRIFSLRGSDYPADQGVIPTKEEQMKYSVQIVYLDDIKHGEMDDKASADQSKKLNEYILHFLEEPTL